MYRYAWAGRGISPHTLEACWRAEGSEGELVAYENRVLRSFASFVSWVGARPLAAEHLSQSELVRKACGRPCEHDHLVRTETLAADWLRVLARLGLPPIALPRVNEARPPSEEMQALHGRSGPAPEVVFTPEVTQLINRLEEPVFAEFGYRMRGMQRNCSQTK